MGFRKEIDILRITPARPEVINERMLPIINEITRLENNIYTLEENLHYAKNDIVKKGIRASLEDIKNKKEKQQLILSKQLRELEKSKRVWKKVSWYTKEKEVKTKRNNKQRKIKL